MSGPCRKTRTAHDQRYAEPDVVRAALVAGSSSAMFSMVYTIVAREDDNGVRENGGRDGAHDPVDDDAAMTLRLGINFGYQDWGNGLPQAVSLVQERRGARLPLGLDGRGLRHRRGHAADVARWPTPSGINFGPAIMQMPARTPAMTAMTAATLDLMSGGRFLLGLGLSGPQVVEGWHGQPYGKPLGQDARVRRHRARRSCGARRRSSTTASTTTSPTRARTRPASASRSRSSCTRGAPTSRSTSRRSARRTCELAAEIADGWLPIFFSPTRSRRRSAPRSTPASRRPAAARRFDDFDVAPTVTVIVGDDVGTLARLRQADGSRSTSAAWARGARTSTTTSRAATATRPRRRRSRTSTSTARSRKRPRPSRRAGRRGRADRAEGTHPRSARAVAGSRRHHDDRRRAAARSAPGHGRARHLIDDHGGAPSCTARWCRRQRSSRLSMLVAPPSTQCRLWCASHHPGGRSQPGATHPRSRITSARHTAAETTRVVRPTSSGADRPSVTTRAMRASQAIRRNVAADNRPTCAASARTWRAKFGPGAPLEHFDVDNTREAGR